MYPNNHSKRKRKTEDNLVREDCECLKDMKLNRRDFLIPYKKEK